MDASSRCRMRWLLSILLSSAFVLAWPDLFLFSKVAHVPAWAQSLPDPWFAAWLLMLVALSLALPGAGRLGTMAIRLLALAAIGPACGVIACAILWRMDTGDLMFQILWVFVTCSVPPASVLVLIVALLRTGAVRRGPHH